MKNKQKQMNQFEIEGKDRGKSWHSLGSNPGDSQLPVVYLPAVIHNQLPASTILSFRFST